MCSYFHSHQQLKLLHREMTSRYGMTVHFKLIYFFLIVDIGKTGSISNNNGTNNYNNNNLITTLFKSQVVVAEHECSTNWEDCKRNKSNQMNESNQSNQIKLN